jgi:SH3 domain-containing protein/putative zinc finger protein
MNDSRNAVPQTQADRSAACPDFEDLSRFVDGEADGERAAHIRAHVTRCAWCSGLATMIRAYFEAAAASADAVTGESSCGTTEVLVSYLTTGLSDAERHSIDTHVRGCDQCIRTLTLLQRRLLSAEQIPAPVPASVIERAAAAAISERRPAKPAAGLSEAWSALSSVGRRLSVHIRLPALVPAAVAAGALLVVAGEHNWMKPEPKEMTRAVPSHRSLRITVPEAVVRAQPSSRTDIVATLSRGTMLEVTSLEKDWYRVTLPSGAEGWVERQAFE